MKRCSTLLIIQFSSVQSLSCVWLFVTPWTVAHRPSLSITNSQSLTKLMSIELVMDRGAWRAVIHEVTKSRTRLSDWNELNWTELNNEWCWASFHVFVSHLYGHFSLEQSLFRPFSHFLIEFSVFLALSCTSCLYILEINPLSVVSLAIIFSHSEDCLFTLLIVSFAMQKLLSLIRSHLFTFVFISITLGGGS